MPTTNEVRSRGWKRIVWGSVAFLAGIVLYSIYPSGLYPSGTVRSGTPVNSARFPSATQLAAAIGAASEGVGSESSVMDKRKEESGEATEAWPEDATVVDPTLAAPSLEPNEVVQLQMESIQAAHRDLSRLAACYSLASPWNRMTTGPFTRFSAMVQQPPYDTLWQCRDWQLGSPVINGTVATVLVTVTGVDEHIDAFRFVLERQSDIPYAGCWMTSVVQPMTLIPKDEPGSKSTTTSREDMSLELQAE